MTPDPITIPQLDAATSVDFENDSLIIRQGLNDRKIKPALLNQFKLENFSPLTSQVIASDVIIIGRNNGGTYTNLITDPRRIGFLAGVVMWFYCDTANVPLYWTNVPALADRVLAVQGGGSSYANVGAQGTWQQENHTLTIAEMPNHRHAVNGAGATSGSGNLVRGFRNSSGESSKPWDTRSEGGGGGHNHGATWRPAAAVGLVCQKTG